MPTAACCLRRFARLQSEAARIGHQLLLDPATLRTVAAQGTALRDPIRIIDQRGISHRDAFIFIHGKYDPDPSLQHLYKRYGEFGIFKPSARLKLLVSIIEASTTVTPRGAGLDPARMIAGGALLVRRDRASNGRHPRRV